MLPAQAGVIPEVAVPFNYPLYAPRAGGGDPLAARSAAASS